MLIKLLVILGCVILWIALIAVICFFWYCLNRNNPQEDDEDGQF